MGQTTSVQSNANSGYTNEKDVLISFDKRAVKSLTAPELTSFKANICGRSLEDTVTTEELKALLRLPDINDKLSCLLASFFQTLSNFPLIKDCYENITYVGVLKSCLLINRQRCLKYVHDKFYDHKKLVFIALALNKNVKELSATPNSVESLDVSNIVSNFNNVSMDELTVPADAMLEFVTLMLRISMHTTTTNSKLGTSLSKSWDSFKIFALNIVRTMNPCIVTSQDTLKNVITYTSFSETLSLACPSLLLPLERLVEHILFLERDLVNPHALSLPKLESKLATEPLLSQLATIWPRELVFSKLQKLYVGRDSGFSMRSFQAKVFKWMAPSMMLVNGIRIPDDEEYVRSKNHRYQTFLNEYPRLKDEDQETLPPFTGKKKLTFAVYVNEPWKITNAELFGDTKTTIIQLSPIQEVYKAATPGNVCFNTLGGGIGIGSSLPVLKNSSRRYVPGNVSLTIDPNLEFGAFRNVGRGGSINPGSMTTGCSEHKFLIQDIEVWGCGGEKELEEQLKNWEWEEAEAQRRQRINLKSINDDRALLELAGLVGQNQSGGSM
ncbi:LAME_0D02872g1_1 [Lachancea meyersii CBS 8951]|uniref:LAME_0D02872g1_1 n=1 Tax=Lachancea meyersii CBS 8951 TaxID=1266667 RepID=A0A1G4J7L3_9SACH|nr:LAME_0D02872g1_1 [Lachancea meyersii CBS 8951]